MDLARQYSVMTTGTIASGFDENQVAADFSTLLCSPLETAQSFINAKKCVVADIDEDRARMYEESLTQIGLQVVLVPSDERDAANDDYSGDEPHATREDYSGDNLHGARDDYSDLAQAPSATTLYPESPDSLVVDLRPPDSYEYDLDKDHGRVYRLAFLGLVAAALVGTIYTTRDQVTSTVNGLSEPTTHVKTARASEDVNKLLEMSGLNAQFESFTASLPDVFEEYFEPIIEEDPSITDAGVSRLMRLVPKAYTEDALQISVANRLNRMAYASDILVLQDIYEESVVQSYVQRSASRNVLTDRADFDRFKKELEAKPLSRARLNAVTAIVDAMVLDKTTQEIERDLNRNLIATAGALRPDNGTPEAKARVQNEVKLMRDRVGAESNTIRLQRIAQLAWQYEDADIGELHLLRSAVDRSLVRTLIRETTTAYETFMRDATLWLHSRLDGG